MKIQELAIIFVIIILPISIILSEYTQFQIQTINLQTAYDAKLTSSTYDAIKAFQLNSINNSTSDLANSKLRDLEASIETFRNSIMTAFELNGYREDDLNNYIPALVYTLYDGLYIYSPYENTHDETGNIITGKKDEIYGLKPYINYSCRYKTSNIDVVIGYTLDNYVTVQGILNDQYINKSGYLIEGINYNEANDTVTYNGIEIKTEHLKENIGNATYSYAKINGTKYYLLENYLKNEDGSNKDCIVYFLNSTPVIQYQEGDTQFISWKNKILNNDSAKQYYKDAYEFTKWFKSTDLDSLTYSNALDEVIAEDGTTSITNVWGEDNTIIFDFDSGTNIENELSNFNQHRLAVIRHKIETNLAIAISNYNSYSGATTNVFQMPELKEDEWEHITHNISLISFLQGLPIGGKIYNGYSLVTNSESREVVLEDNIYILGSDGNYHKIGDKGFENAGGISVDAGTAYVGEETQRIRSAGRLNLDFKRTSMKNSTTSYYNYPLKAYNASYDSIIMQNNVTTYDDIYAYVNNQSVELKEAFYTALGREREGKYRTNNIVQNKKVLVEYAYTSGVQEFIVPETGNYKLEVWGASGGSLTKSNPNVTDNYNGGHGGYSTGEIELTAGEKLYIVVGGKGTGATTTGQDIEGGYNGGGSVVGNASYNHMTASGGGATHIARANNRGELKNYADYKNEILIVAGGGGGARDQINHENAARWGHGGAGGGLVGKGAISSNGTIDALTQLSELAGSQTTGNSFGQGGLGSSQSGGGGGFYGGYSGNYSDVIYAGAGSGGSGFLSSELSKKQSISGENQMPNYSGSEIMTGNKGNGYARITYIKK